MKVWFVVSKEEPVYVPDGETPLMADDQVAGGSGPGGKPVNKMERDRAKLNKGLVSKPDNRKKINGRPSKRSLADAQRALNDNQLRYAVWLSMPEVARRPSSKRQFAQTIGVAYKTVLGWDKHRDVILATRWLQLNAAGDPLSLSSVLDFLKNTALDDTQYMNHRLTAAKEWLGAVGVKDVWRHDNKLLETKQVDEIDLDSLSDEEIWELYNQRANMVGLETPELPGSDDMVVDAEIVEDDD